MSGVVAVALVVTACSGDDDSADDTVATAPTGTVAGTTEPPATDPPTTTTPPTTTEAPTTTVDVEALKAQIAEDYLATEQALEDLNRSPTLDGLDARVGAIGSPGSYIYSSVVDFVRGMVERGERVTPGNPDYSDATVESVLLLGDPGLGQAEVTACIVSNQARVNGDGSPVGEPHTLFAARVRQPMTLTQAGWRQSDQGTRISIEEGATSCAP